MNMHKNARLTPIQDAAHHRNCVHESVQLHVAAILVYQFCSWSEFINSKVFWNQWEQIVYGCQKLAPQSEAASRNCWPRLLYFFAIEMARRRFASLLGCKLPDDHGRHRRSWKPFGFLFATSMGGPDWPFGCTRKSIATVMNITIWLFGAMRTRICSTAQCGIFCLFFQTNSGYKVASFPLGDD